MNKESIFATILAQKKITTVFQPIVSLTDGGILGYEALSRITLPSVEMNIEELFHMACEKKKIWELEKLCRGKALKNAGARPAKSKLFINVDANIIHDDDFKEGFTVQKLSEYGIDCEDIVFEITEKNAIEAIEAFTSSICHYRMQKFKIAIDDFGSGHSGLNRVCAFSPEFLKLDMELIRDIDKDAVKRTAVESTINFCKQIGIQVIAEGIETERELQTLVQLGAHYGQGYYLAKPAKQFTILKYEQQLQIKSFNSKSKTKLIPSLFGKITDIGKPHATVKYDDSTLPIYEAMSANLQISEYFVVNEQGELCGFLPRRHILERYSGVYGYNLTRRAKVSQIMLKEFLSVDEDTSIDKVSELAMQRDAACVYDSIAVTRNGAYLSSVTIKDLLLTAVQLQVKRATDSNPLTGLPGNNQIQEVIASSFVKPTPWAIIYLDLDNFKAYNDAYGFSNGDLMITAVAESIKNCCNKNDFIGHIGGDDFVVILNSYHVEDLCKRICKMFRELIRPLYNTADWEQGFIVSKNRNGFTQNFDIATLSIAVVTNKDKQPANMEALSKIIAQTKKQCKQQAGNSIVIV